MTRKELVQIAENMRAEDITYYSEEKINEIESREGWLSPIACSVGTYGRNAAILIGAKTKSAYVVKCRTMNIFRV